MKYKIMILILLFLINIGFFMIGLNISNISSNINKEAKLSLLDDNSNCSNLSLVDTSYCLNKKVNSFYKYNMSNYEKEINLTQLKIEGGVCYQWANYYIDTIKQLGYNGTNVQFFINNSEGHAIALLYSNDLKDYCILDQVNLIGCGKTGGIK